MNRLIIDLGNSRLKWMLSDGEQAPSPAAITLQEAPLNRLLDHHWRSLPPPGQVIVSSVADKETNTSLSLWCKEQWRTTPRFLQSCAYARGVSNAYREPARLGVDRWAALVAAFSLWPGEPLCIADCGTAVTFDALNGDGRHLGGLILPGLALMRHALSDGTAGILESISPLPGKEWLGRSTESGIALGCIRAITTLLEQGAARLGKTAKTEVRCLLTGGDAPLLLPYLSKRWQHHPNLVLEGTRLLAEDETCTLCKP